MDWRDGPDQRTNEELVELRHSAGRKLDFLRMKRRLIRKPSWSSLPIEDIERKWSTFRLRSRADLKKYLDFDWSSSSLLSCGTKGRQIFDRWKNRFYTDFLGHFFGSTLSISYVFLYFVHFGVFFGFGVFLEYWLLGRDWNFGHYFIDFWDNFINFDGFC